MIKLSKVYITGVGMTRVADHWDKDLKDLFMEAANKALADSIETHMDALYIANMCAGLAYQQENLASMLATYLNVDAIPAFRIEAGEASGAAAVLQAYQAIKSGLFDTAMVVGVEKLSDLPSTKLTLTISTTADSEYDLKNGATIQAIYAIIMKQYMNKFKATREQIAQFAVQMHRNAVKNPYAYLRFEINLKSILKAPPIAEPITLYDEAAMTDGAAAIILSRNQPKNQVSVAIEGIGVASAPHQIGLRHNLTEMACTTLAAKKAYKIAGINSSEIDIVEVHDNYTITGITSIEDLGFFKKGEAAKAVEQGLIAPDGELPVNVSGGLKARGHPLGATGVYQLAELTLQLRGEALEAQIPDVETALAHNMAGTGSLCITTILRRIK